MQSTSNDDHVTVCVCVRACVRASRQWVAVPRSFAG